MKTSVGQGGRIVIPAPYRKALGLRTGVEVIVRLEMGELRICTPAQALQHAQGLVRRYVPQEPGTEAWIAVIGGSVISAVNLSEVVAKLADAGMPEAEIRDALDPLGLEVADFEAEDAYRAGMLRPQTRGFGLSLGDRACLALARQANLP